VDVHSLSVRAEKAGFKQRAVVSGQ
jgi:hypothetical protein